MPPRPDVTCCSRGSRVSSSPPEAGGPCEDHLKRRHHPCGSTSSWTFRHEGRPGPHILEGVEAVALLVSNEEPRIHPSCSGVWLPHARLDASHAHGKAAAVNSLLCTASCLWRSVSCLRPTEPHHSGTHTMERLLSHAKSSPCEKKKCLFESHVAKKKLTHRHWHAVNTLEHDTKGASDAGHDIPCQHARSGPTVATRNDTWSAVVNSGQFFETWGRRIREQSGNQLTG